MAVDSSPTLLKIIAEFGGPGNLSAYVRGGAYVPNTAPNAAISTTVDGLRISQFAGASKGTPFTASMSTNWLYAHRATAGTLTANNPVSASGGTGSYTYSTTRTGGLINVINGTTSTPGGSYSGAKDTSQNAFFRTVVTSGSESITLDWELYFEWGVPV